MTTMLDSLDSGSGGATQPFESRIDPSQLSAGTAIDGGRYRIEGVLGRGNFGITYAAEDTRLHRPVAIKELFPPGCIRVGRTVVARPMDEGGEIHFGHLRARFVDEASHLARFAHVGIVRVYELIEEHGTAYVVMERLTGSSLSRVLRQRGGRLAFDEALRIADDIGAALTVIHDSGLLHRDLKPDNVVITEDGRTVLVDFGAARQFVPDLSSTMTQLVTPGYAPLEQYSSRSNSGPATDVYGLAATVYRMLAGQPPPAATDRLLGARLVSLAQLARRVPPFASPAVAHGLELQAPNRPQSARAFLAELHGRGPDRATQRSPDQTVRSNHVLDRPVDIRWLQPLQEMQHRVQREIARSAARLAPWLPSPRRSVARPPTPVRAWLPVLAGLAAIASVAPLHVAVAVAFVALPVANAIRETRAVHQHRCRTRGKRWHDPVTLPAVFMSEAGHSVAAVAAEIIEPLVVTIAAISAAVVLPIVVHDRGLPIGAIRVIAAASVVGLTVWLVSRLARHPRFSSALAGDLLAPLVKPDQRLSSAGRMAWAVAVALGAFVIANPVWPLG